MPKQIKTIHQQLHDIRLQQFLERTRLFEYQKQKEAWQTLQFMGGHLLSELAGYWENDGIFERVIHRAKEEYFASEHHLTQKLKHHEHTLMQSIQGLRMQEKNLQTELKTKR